MDMPQVLSLNVFDFVFGKNPTLRKEPMEPTRGVRNRQFSGKMTYMKSRRRKLSQKILTHTGNEDDEELSTRIEVTFTKERGGTSGHVNFYTHKTPLPTSSSYPLFPPLIHPKKKIK